MTTIKSIIDPNVEEKTMAERTNDDWLSSLRHPIDDQALDDLRRILLRGLRAGLRTKGAIADTDLEDSVDPNLAFLCSFLPLVGFQLQC